MSWVASTPLRGITVISDDAELCGWRVALACSSSYSKITICGRRRRGAEAALPDKQVSWKAQILEVTAANTEALVLLNVNELVARSGLDPLCRAVSSLLSEGLSLVVLLVHRNVNKSEMNARRLLAVADNEIRLSEKNGEVEAAWRLYRNNGLAIEGVELLYLTEVGGVSGRKEEKKKEPTSTAPPFSEMSGSFSRAAANTLPYAASQREEGLVAVHGRGKVRVGGRVIYSPDEADDLDDSDPDDDLNL